MNKQEFEILKSIFPKSNINNIEDLLNHSKDPYEYNFVSNWVNNCKEIDIEIEIPKNDLILAAINEELNTEGIQSIFDDEGKKLFSYCNTGDEFGITVMYHHISEKFILSSFINIIEAIEEDMLEMFLSD